MKPLSRTASFILAVCLFVGATSLSLTLAFLKKAANKEPEESESSEKEPVNTGFEYKTQISDAVMAALNTTDTAYLILANKTVLMEEDQVPADLTDVNTAYTLYGKELQMESAAALAAVALIDEMRAYGLTKVYITSGYRSYVRQQILFDQYYNQEKAKHPDWTDAQLKAQVLTYSAAPGTSEHQTGLCMDLFVSPGMQELENYGREGNVPDDIGFAETEEFQWLKENAHKFGFILRYPENKTDVTGYAYESWHYRFVGIEAATEIYQKGITLEEYLGK